MKYWQAIIVGLFAADIAQLKERDFPFWVELLGSLGFIGLYYIAWKMAEHAARTWNRRDTNQERQP